MASSIVLRSARSGRKHIDLASRFLPAKTWPARIGSFPKFFRFMCSSKDSDIDVIGIDFGTTNSCVSVIEGNVAKVIEDSSGSRSIPSVVAFGSNGECLVGVPAKLQALTNPNGTIFGLKHIIGRRFDDLAHRKVPYQIISASNGDAVVEVNRKKYTPSEICSELLKKLKETANNYLGKDVTNAVITVPAYFNDAQRRATVKAGRLAGFNVLKIISEPFAAALSYGVNLKEDGHVAIVHFGGATLMVYILEMSHGVIEIKAFSGYVSGGEEFDNILLGYLVTEFEKKESINLSTDKLALGRLREAAEKAKVELSTTTEAEILLPCITADASGDKHLHITLSRSKLESLFSGFIENIKKSCERCLKQADVSAKDIAEVLLVGSMTQVPKVQEVVMEIFGKSPSQGVNPDEAVALGAAIVGGILSKDLKVDVDWGLRGAVTDITTQGSACTCWALGVRAAVEGIFFIKNGILNKFSAQQIVDCAGPDGVEGAPQERAYNYFITHGVCLDVEYPYTGARQDCLSIKSSRVFIDGVGRVGYGNKDLLAAVKEQPLTAGLSGSFVKSPVYQSYKGGPYFGDNYDFTTDALPHLVCIIGSEVIEGQKFLKIKESRGEDWGDEGILHLAMSRDFYFGLGDVNMSVLYPIIRGDKAVYITDTQISKLREAFTRFDGDGDGVIETKVLGRVLMYLGKPLPEAELQEMITEAGAGQNETIGFPRFRNMIARKLKYTVIAELEDLFKRVDMDNDGFISASEFLMLMNGVDETAIQALFQVADTDEDGQLNCEEFVRMMQPK